MRRLMRTRPKPAWFVALTDIVLVGLALVIFSLFHHVLPSVEEVVGTTSGRDGRPQATSTAAQAPAPTQQPLATQAAPNGRVSTFPQMPVPMDAPIAHDDGGDAPTGDFSIKYADLFGTGTPRYTQTNDGFTYVSRNVNLTFTTYHREKLVYHVADFYIRDITNYQTAFANDTFGKGQRESVINMAKRSNALLAVNGDYYGHGSSGIVIRNGTLYRDKMSGNDVCVLFWDGTMQVYEPGEITGAKLIEMGAYQSWDFGPSYLDANGASKTAFNSSVGPANPRTVLGYYEPGHYCIVCIDGRSDTSVGLTNTNTSKLMESLGCTVAYNLDGGQSTVMTWQGEIVNVPYNGGRSSSDIVLITE